MRFYQKNDSLFIETDERMDSTNAKAVEEEIRKELSSYQGKSLCFDSDKLKYISSLGLRVLLGLCHEGYSVRMINVSSEVKEILEMTGFNTFLEVQKKKRRIDLTGCQIIGEGAFGSVYKLSPDTVIKVFRGDESLLPMIENEKEKARRAFLSGVPTAIPFDVVETQDGAYGAVFEMIDAQNCNQIIREDPAVLDQMIPQYAEFIRSIHKLEAKSGELRDNRKVFIDNLDSFTNINGSLRDRLRMLLLNMPEDNHLVHGDIQLKNVMYSEGNMILIDMDRLGVGNPVFEFAGLFATYLAFNEAESDNTLKFLGIGYENATRIFNETFGNYLRIIGKENDHEEYLIKVKILGYLRFLEILIIEQSNVVSELKDLRIQTATDCLGELAYKTDSLAF